jgi:hypothetical protein
MRKYEYAAGIALLICLQACGAGAGNNAAGASNGAANAAAGTGSAAGGPCPFETRNWRVTVGPSPYDPAMIVLRVDGQQRQAASGQYGDWDVQPATAGHDVIVDARVARGQPGVGHWSDVGFEQTDDPAVTRVILRCGGADIVRLPVVRRR